MALLRISQGLILTPAFLHRVSFEVSPPFLPTYHFLGTLTSLLVVLSPHQCFSSILQHPISKNKDATIRQYPGLAEKWEKAVLLHFGGGENRITMLLY